MKNRGTPALIALFFAGLIGLWWLDYAHVPDRDARRLAEPRVLPRLWEARPDDVQRLEIAGGPKKLVFERRPGDRWQMVEPLDVAADPSLVENLAFNLKMLERIRGAGTLAGKAADFGLEPPSRTIRLYGPGSAEPIAGLEIGGTAANRDRRYVRALDSGKIEVVEAARVALAELPAESWRDRMLVRVATPDVRSLEAARADGSRLRLDRKGDHWNLVEPFACVADEGKVDGLVAEVAGLRVPADGFAADGATDLARYGLDRPALRITVTPRGRDPIPQTILIGKPAPDDPAAKDKEKDKRDRRYALREGQDDVVIIDAARLTDLGARPADLHAKKVGDVEPEKVDAIRLTSEGVTVVAVRRPKGWGRIEPLRDRADAEAVAELLKKVSTAEASVLFEAKSAPDPQTDRPMATLELWQNSGPRPGEGPAAAPASRPSLALKIGRRDPVARTVFVQAEGDPVVMAVPLSFLDGWTFGGLALRDRQVASVSPPQVARIAVKQGPGEVVVEAPPDHNPNAWRMTAPAEGPADPETVGRALFALASLRAEALVADRAGSDARHGLDAPALTIAWKTRDELAPPPRRTIEGEETTLTIGSVVPNKPDQPRYARISSSPIVFTLPSTFVALFEGEWRDRRVFALDPRGTDRIVFRWPSLTMTARQADPGPAGGDRPEWSLVDAPADLKFDRAQLDPLVKTLASLTTPRFAQYAGPIAPSMGLFPGKLVVEAHPKALARARTLRLGAVSKDGYFYATTEDGPSGAVFLLPLSNWAPWVNLPTLEKAAKTKAEGEAAAKKAEPPK